MLSPGREPHEVFHHSLLGGSGVSVRVGAHGSRQEKQYRSTDQFILHKHVLVSDPAVSTLCTPCRGSEPGNPGSGIPDSRPRFHWSPWAKGIVHDSLSSGSGSGGTGSSENQCRGSRRSFKLQAPLKVPSKKERQRVAQTPWKQVWRNRKETPSGSTHLPSSSFPRGSGLSLRPAPGLPEEVVHRGHVRCLPPSCLGPGARGSLSWGSFVHVPPSI